MQLNNGTGCLVVLIGNLIDMPIILKNKSNESVIVVTRKRYCLNETQNKMECFRVILNRDDTARIINFGYLGMTVSIYGDLRKTTETEVIAEKIDFIYFPNVNEQEATSAGIISTEKSYWFRHDGSIRKELTYIH